MERRKDLDFAKGIGIVLMVLGHSYSEGNGEAIRTWFYSFHMPLFFIIAGILAHNQRTSSTFFVYLKKRVQGLLVPYYIWCTIAALFLTVMGRKPMDWLLGVLKSVITLEGLSAMWFLPCLFFAELLFRGCRYASKRNSLLGHGIAAILALLGFAVPTSNVYLSIILRSLTGASFIYLGWWLADLLNRPCKFRTWAVLCALQAFLAAVNGQVSVLGREYGNFVLFYLNALLGSWLMIQLYRILMRIGWEPLGNLFVWFGKNSLIVVCTSLYAIEFLRLADYKLLGGILPAFGDAEGIILCSLAMGLEAIAIIFCGKYLWFTFGRKNPKLVHAALSQNK